MNIRRIIFIGMLLTLTGCSDKHNDLSLAPSVNQYRPSMESSVQTNTETMVEETTSVTAQPSPDMYEESTEDVWNFDGSTVGKTGFDNLPAVTRKSKGNTTTQAETTQGVTQPTWAMSLTQTQAAPTTAPETSPVETTAAPKQEKVWDLIEVGANEQGVQMGAVAQKYSKEADPQYTVRGAVAYRRKITVPDVVGYDKDAYGNYIINPSIFTNQQTKLPKFSSYGYKIPYLYWYDSNQELLNPLPSAYGQYVSLFYMADDEVADPYETTAAPETTASSSSGNYSYNSSYTNVTQSTNSLNIKSDTNTETKFKKHASDIYDRVYLAKRSNQWDSLTKTDIEYALDKAEIEYARSLGLVGYYENRIGPGYVTTEGSSSTTYKFTDPTTDEVHTLTFSEMKELLGSGKWRELNRTKIQQTLSGS